MYVSCVVGVMILISIIGLTTINNTKDTNEKIILTEKGTCLDVSNMVNIKKKFRRTKATVDGVIASMKQLEEDGIGHLTPKKPKGKVKPNVIISLLTLLLKSVISISKVLANARGIFLPCCFNV